MAQGWKSSEGKVLASHITILLVDDDPLICSLGKELLEHLGYHVLTAQDGAQALEAYRQQGPVELVILDYHLPGGNGLAVMEDLKALDAGLRVVVASGYFSPQEVVRLREKGASGLIHKPFRARELEAHIRLALAGMAGW